METQLIRDKFAVLFYDDARDILELRWLPETEAMTDDDFMRWLEQFAASAQEHRAPFLLIDTRAFQHHTGAHVWPWRDEHIIPRYNQAGVKKFAFLLPTGAATKTEPMPEGPARFPTGYFESREQIDRWFTS
jgi:hypothetical protein